MQKYKYLGLGQLLCWILTTSIRATFLYILSLKQRNISDCRRIGCEIGLAGDSIDELAEDYNCDRLQIEEGIRSELPLLVA